MRTLTAIILAWALLLAGPPARAAGEYVLGAGDTLRITVFQNPDLSTEVRVSENGQIGFPLLGNVTVGGLSVSAAEKTLAEGLKRGNYVLSPSVTIFPLQMRGNQVAALGQFNHPGRYPLETANMRVADLVAVAGGLAPGGGDVVILTGLRQDGPIRREIPLADLVARGSAANEPLHGGDILFADRAPVFYIYGEVQKPGAYRLELGMTLMQALATGGGLTLRGTEKGIRVHRRGADGKVQVIQPTMDDPVQVGDVVYVKESLF